MKASFAKYKVYLHQDVRILNPFFIYDLIDAFRRNPDAGMIGMIGTESVPDSGVMWQAKRYGAVVHTESSEEHMADTFDENSPFGSDFSAALTDGFLIATCVDLPWREDVFKGWHFYDASQSMEFKSHGYNIIIPTQDPGVFMILAVSDGMVMMRPDSYLLKHIWKARRRAAWR